MVNKNNKNIICLFRKDLRVTDNPALHNAVKEGKIIPIYVYDYEESKDENYYPIDENYNFYEKNIGEASKLWLHFSLNNLNKSLCNNLILATGKIIEVIKYINESLIRIDELFLNLDFTNLEKDKEIKHFLEEKLNIRVRSFNSSLLFDPRDILKEDGTPYKVFTPFYRKGCFKHEKQPRKPLPRINHNEINFHEKINTIKNKPITIKEINISFTNVEGLKLIDQKYNWQEKILNNWQLPDKIENKQDTILASEVGAVARLEQFIKNGLDKYKDERNIPCKEYSTSKMSPFLAFGQISPNQIIDIISNYENSNRNKTNNHEPNNHEHIENINCIKLISLDKNIDHFYSELGWREFSYNLIHHNPSLYHKNLQKKFDNFPWRNCKKSEEDFEAWKKGKTGIPIVDAGMRELWDTGFMHNRTRMICASFLIKNLRIDWRKGQRWFFNCLLDADAANNSASWQWVAGSGADAAPYFRIFNPVTQAEKFDPEGKYIKKWVPELKNISTPKLFNPSGTSKNNLLDYNSNFTIGDDYPKTIVDLKKSRELALDKFKEL
ncbi:MAG TPA: deoxyribodipyrimidine photo-lyase [Candidatus Megaira endosymbiont of Hartmannula sinica]|nr:deoxyribodipyrimidine photo-lyase [Candidatus Megaera endosymbiont of Hartmannula sinica]